MNPLLLTGRGIVVLALGSYTTAIITQIRQRRPTAIMRGFLTAGVTLDATATAFMIAGSRRIPLTFHGILAYSAFLLMATDLVRMWKWYRLRSTGPLPAKFHRYSPAAYSWWVLAFVEASLWPYVWGKCRGSKEPSRHFKRICPSTPTSVS
jgi:hypothetical protein